MIGALETAFSHVTVLLQETVDFLAPRSGGVYADVTVGGGGHAEAILERSAPEGRVVGIDRDPDALAFARKRLARFGERVSLVHGRMGEAPTLLRQSTALPVDGLIADLGLSSPQLDRPERGFSFRYDGPLDMRMDPTSGVAAHELIASLSTDELANVLFEFGEERKSRPIARSIHRAQAEGQLETTGDLRQAVHRAVGGKRGPIDPATRTFQALRIAVNEELDELLALLQALPTLLSDGAVAALSQLSFIGGSPSQIRVSRRPSTDAAYQEAHRRWRTGAAGQPALPECEAPGRPTRAARGGRLVSARFLALWAAAVLACAAAFVVHLAMRYETVSLGYEVGKERREQERLIEQRRLLAIEAATLRQTHRVDAIARGTLKMSVPEPERVVSVGLKRRGRTSGRVR